MKLNKWIVENNWKSDSLKRIIIKVIRTVRLVEGSNKGFVPKQGKIITLIMKWIYWKRNRK